jgi:hypothetical protein
VPIGVDSWIIGGSAECWVLGTEEVEEEGRRTDRRNDTSLFDFVAYARIPPLSRTISNTCCNASRKDYIPLHSVTLNPIFSQKTRIGVGAITCGLHGHYMEEK